MNTDNKEPTTPEVQATATQPHTLTEEQIKKMAEEKFPDYTDHELVKYNFEQKQVRDIWIDGAKTVVEWLEEVPAQSTPTSAEECLTEWAKTENWDKHDKNMQRFSYWEMVEFAEHFHSKTATQPTEKQLAIGFAEWLCENYQPKSMSDNMVLDVDGRVYMISKLYDLYLQSSQNK